MQATYRPNLVIFPKKNRPEFYHNKADIGNLQLHTVSYGCRTQIFSPPTKDVFLLVIPLSGSGHITHGKNDYTAQRNDLFILPPSDELTIKLSEHFKQLTIQIPEACFQQHIITQLGQPFENPLSFTPFHKNLSGGVMSLISLTQAIISDLDTNALFNRNDYTAQHLENTIVSLILDGFENSYKAFTTQIKHTCRPKHVRKAEEYIAGNYQSAISIHELAKELGITSRSLQLGFRQYLNTSPSAYVKNIRLKKAREQLLSSESEHHSISDIAALCGFNHLSNFARYYKSLFGETPSQTLREKRK